MSGESSRELPGTCAVVLAVALGSACCIGGGGSAQSPSTDAEAADVEPTSGQGAPLSSQYARPEILKAASGFLDRHFGTDRDRLAALPPAELAKRLTYAVFNYCTNTRPFVELEQLFEVCRAQCAGYVYVLGGLLSWFGLETTTLWALQHPAAGKPLRARSGDPTGRLGPLRSDLRDVPRSGPRR